MHLPGAQPTRIRRSRAKGWRMPADTVYVGRPTQWGNPFVIDPGVEIPEYGLSIPPITTPAQTVELFRERLLRTLQHNPDYLEPLKGMHLCCWCALDQPCHADVLLDMANRSVR